MSSSVRSANEQSSSCMIVCGRDGQRVRVLGSRTIAENRQRVRKDTMKFKLNVRTNEFRSMRNRHLAVRNNFAQDTTVEYCVILLNGVTRIMLANFYSVAGYEEADTNERYTSRNGKHGNDCAIVFYLAATFQG